MSNPHFLDGEYYQQRVNGLHPDPAIHTTHIDVEPVLISFQSTFSKVSLLQISGITMSAAKRLQVNVHLQPDMILYPNIREDLYVPLSWIEESSQLTDKQANQFKSSVYLALTVEKAVLWSGVAVGALLLIVTVVLAVRTRKLYVVDGYVRLSGIQ
jgi:hypothetical protein